MVKVVFIVLFVVMFIDLVSTTNMRSGIIYSVFITAFAFSVYKILSAIKWLYFYIGDMDTIVVHNHISEIVFGVITCLICLVYQLFPLVSRGRSKYDADRHVRAKIVLKNKKHWCSVLLIGFMFLGCAVVLHLAYIEGEFVAEDFKQELADVGYDDSVALELLSRPPIEAMAGKDAIVEYTLREKKHIRFDDINKFCVTTGMDTIFTIAYCACLLMSGWFLCCAFAIERNSHNIPVIPMFCTDIVEECRRL